MSSKKTSKKRLEYISNWQSENREKVREYKRQYKLRNAAKRREYERNKRNTDIQVKLKTNLRSRLYKSVRGIVKAGSAVKDMGCTVSQLKQHLESLFQEGMSWDNYGDWHVDHIKPLSKFDLTDKDQFLQACHYTNLQPLWAKDNLEKSNTYEF